MNWGQIRTLVRRQINEVTAQAWADADLDVYMQIAYGIIQKEISKYDPYAFTATELHATVANTTDYSLTITPVGNLGVIKIERAADSALNYKKQERKDLDVIREMIYNGVSSDDASSGVWALSGQNTFVIAPTPVSALANGLRVTYKPVLIIGGDSAIPEVPLQLHWAIALLTKMTALGETWQDTELSSRRLTEILADVPLYYQREDAENSQWRPDGIHLGTAR